MIIKPEPDEIVEKLSSDKEASIDAALGLQAISIRLQKDIITKLKVFAKNEGLGYQPFIRQILTRYVRDNSIGNKTAENKASDNTHSGPIDLI